MLASIEDKILLEVVNIDVNVARLFSISKKCQWEDKWGRNETHPCGKHTLGGLTDHVSISNLENIVARVLCAQHLHLCFLLGKKVQAGFD